MAKVEIQTTYHDNGATEHEVPDQVAANGWPAIKAWLDDHEDDDYYLDPSPDCGDVDISSVYVNGEQIFVLDDENAVEAGRLRAELEKAGTVIRNLLSAAHPLEANTGPDVQVIASQEARAFLEGKPIPETELAEARRIIAALIAETERGIEIMDTLDDGEGNDDQNWDEDRNRAQANIDRAQAFLGGNPEPDSNKWTEADRDRAHAEGWDVEDCELRDHGRCETGRCIQALDNYFEEGTPVYTNDDMLQIHLVQRARLGEQLAAKALRLTRVKF